MTTEIHIVRDDSAGGIIKQAINPKPGNILISLDAFSYRPLPVLKDLNEWRRIRNDYWKSMYSETGLPPIEEHEHDILLNTDRLQSAENVVLWLGTGLEEQLLLVWTVQLFKIISVDLKRLLVIQFREEPNKGFEVVSPATLKPDQLLAHPSPKPLTKAQIRYIDAAWHALTASQPKPLMNILNKRPERTLYLLHRSLKTLLRRFPDIGTGLNHWDYELLKHTLTNGPTAIGIVARTFLDDTDHLDRVGDICLYYRLRRLGAKLLKKQLVELTGKTPKMRHTEARLTETGRQVLDGKANFVKINGIDEWVCGMHLQSRTNEVWYRKGDALVKAES